MSNPLAAIAEQTIIERVLADLTTKERAAQIIRSGLTGNPVLCHHLEFAAYLSAFQDLGYLVTTLEKAEQNGLLKKPDAHPIIFSLSEDGDSTIGYFLQDCHFIYPVHQN